MMRFPTTRGGELPGAAVWVWAFIVSLLHVTEGRAVMPPEQPPPSVLRIAIDGDTLWLATTNGLLQFDSRRRSERIWGEEDGLPSRVIADVARHGSDLWVATPEGVAVKRDARFAPIDQGLPSRDATCLLATRGGSLYVGTGRGIALFAGSGWKLIPETHQFVRERVHAAVEAPDGSAWFAKTNAISVLDGDKEREILWRDPLNPPSVLPLPSTAVQAMAVDAGGRLWLASDVGLSILRGRELVRHETWRPKPWGIGGLPGRRVWAIFHARDGAVWISFGDGPDRGFVARRTAEHLPWEILPLPAHGGLPVAAYSFAQGADGALWLGTSAGLYQWSDEKPAGFRRWLPIE